MNARCKAVARGCRYLIVMCSSRHLEAGWGWQLWPDPTRALVMFLCFNWICENSKRVLLDSQCAGVKTNYSEYRITLYIESEHCFCLAQCGLLCLAGSIRSLAEDFPSPAT